MKTVITPLQPLNDRANDCWEPLRQIASIAGGHWVDTAIKAAIRINGNQEENDSISTELLRDIQAIFDSKNITRILSHELVNELNVDNEANWCTWHKNRGITARDIAKRLKEFDIISNTIRIGTQQRGKGYIKEQFNDAFNRYLTTPQTDAPTISVTTGQSESSNDYSQKQQRDIIPVSRIEKTPQTKPNSDCHLVTDKIPPAASTEDQTDQDKGVDFDL